MFHILSSEKGWTHQEMMSMNKSVFMRYFGYYYSGKLMEKENQRLMKAKQKLQDKKL